MSLHSALVDRLKAVLVTTVTPFDADGRVRTIVSDRNVVRAAVDA